MDKGLEQILHQGKHKEGPEHMKRCLASLACREMQIKTTMKYEFMLVRMAIINKATNKCRRGCVEKETLGHYRGNGDW